ncbi:MAG: hypothetical protein ACXIVF_09890 [Rhizobiaceae bacterium]
MLRILAGTLLSGTLLSGAAASSFLTVPPMTAETGPSFKVMDETWEPALPVDPTITASYGDDDAPRVISAPRYVTVSPSISAMTPVVEDLPGTTSIAARGEEAIEADEAPPAPRQQARQVEPMVIRGGLVGQAFPGATPPPPSQAEETQRSASSPPPVDPPASTTPPSPSRSSGAPSATGRGSSRSPEPPSPPGPTPRPFTAVPL